MSLEDVVHYMRQAPRQRVPEVIVSKLLALITSGTLKPGDRLPSEQELAAHLAVSRNAVREATKTLHAMGLLRIEHGRGSFVTSDISRTVVPAAASFLLDPIAASELHQARVVVEVFTAAEAARKSTPSGLAELHRILADAESQSSAPEQWVALDATFHTAIARMAENRFLLRMVETLRDLVVAQSLNLAQLESRIRTASGEHRRIEAAIIARDPAGAAAAMHHHLTTVMQMVEHVVQLGPEVLDEPGPVTARIPPPPDPICST